MKANALVGKLSLLVDLEEQEIELLDNFCQESGFLLKGQSLTPHDDDSDTVILLLEGWACRYKILSDGRRQITSFVLPGDLSGVRACLFGVSDYETEALTDCRVARINGAEIANLFIEQPRLAAAITWGSAREEAMLTERVVSLGRRNAKERIAHLFLEIHSRLAAVGVAERMAYELPITQEIIADCLGLSIVHVNRTLQAMRKDKLLEYRNGYVILHDPRRLKKLCSFDSDHLEGELHPELADL